MKRADPRVVAEEHVVRVDPRVVAAVLDRPLDHEVDVRRVRQVVGADVDDVPDLVAQDDVEVVRVGGHGRARHLLQRLALLVVDLPELVGGDLERDRVDLERRVGLEQLQLRRDRARIRPGAVGEEALRAGNLEDRLRHQAAPASEIRMFPKPSSTACSPGWTRPVVASSRTTAGPAKRMPGRSAVP